MWSSSMPLRCFFDWSDLTVQQISLIILECYNILMERWHISLICFPTFFHVTVRLNRLTLYCNHSWCLERGILSPTWVAHLSWICKCYSSVHWVTSTHTKPPHVHTHVHTLNTFVPSPSLLSRQTFGHMARDEVWCNLVCFDIDYCAFITFLPLGDWRGSG